ncbi:MAG: CDP-diacylglycerol/glycerol-3-phosphate3-phospha tidyltransferase [Blastococcus sp.]|jgi:CDP-diacylglycerol--glycerol-3-phosphate 3-phosphatidyltransferase|nr:CDP-diacylglycerol/glycerol-3-phosphate3-phospha tidyltransferase [Blastococcus sp.]
MWTLPNILTILRLLAVPVVCTVLALEGESAGGRAWALALFVAASITDLADGWLARRRNQCTEFGALADPIADKALVGAALICLSGLGLVPWWATIVVLARELAVTALRLTVLRHGVIPASRGGKVKTATQTVLIVLALATPGWTHLLDAVVVVTVVWTVLTGLDYGVKAAALTRTPTAPPQPSRASVAIGPVGLPLFPAVGRSYRGLRGPGPWLPRVSQLRAQQGGGAESSRVAS